MTERRKIAAILAADVVGFSRMASADEDRILARLRVLRADVIDPIIASQNGRIFKRTGDGALVEFRSVVEAVRCAISVQNAMTERNVGAPEDQRIVFRVGIHLGDVVEESDGDLMGDGVNIAARLEGIASPGSICLSDDAYRQVKGRLDLAVTDLGDQSLKNIAQPMRAYSLQVGVPAQAKPATTSIKKAIHDSRLALAGGLLAALVLVLGGWYLGVGLRSAPTPPRLSVVVLPFANLSGDSAQDYLADALTDELTTGLAHLHGAFVIARNTAFTFKGKPVDVKVIGKDLAVRYVVEGSVQPNGGEIRVNAQLIDAETGAHVWADQFDTSRANLLQMQDEIVTRLAHAMDLQLTEVETARLKRVPRANHDAEDLALQCEVGAWKAGFFGKEADTAYHLCDQALAIDPANVRALVWSSVKPRVAVIFGFSADPKGDIGRADELVSKALTLDPNYAIAHMAKAAVLALQGQLEEAVAEDERALAIDPALAYAVSDLCGNYIMLAQFEKSLECADRMFRLSPRDPMLPIMYNYKAASYFGMKQYDRAIDAASQGIAVNATAMPWLHLNLIAALTLAGRDAEAHEAFQRLRGPPPKGPTTIAAWKVAFSSTVGPSATPRYLESLDRYIAALRKAGMPEE